MLLYMHMVVNIKPENYMSVINLRKQVTQILQLNQTSYIMHICLQGSSIFHENYPCLEHYGNPFTYTSAVANVDNPASRDTHVLVIP